MGRPIRESDTRRFRPLLGGVSVHEIADRCRRAVIEFVSGTAGGWSRVDLDLWLGAPYRSASGAVPRAIRVRGPQPEPLPGVFEIAIMDTADIVRVLLASCARPRTPSFVQHAIDRGFVVGAQDAHGALGHVPVDLAGMTLIDRVASLLAADFLTRPNDYRSVKICEDCGSVSFEWTACEHEACAEARESGVVRRDDEAPVSYAAIFPPPET